MSINVDQMLNCITFKIVSMLQCFTRDNAELMIEKSEIKRKNISMVAKLTFKLLFGENVHVIVYLGCVLYA